MTITINDNLGFPVVDALIYNGKDFFSTDKEGKAIVQNIGLPFQFVAVGHKSLTKLLGDEKNVNIILERTSGDLSEIEIIDSKPVKPILKSKNIILLILLIFLLKK